MTLTFDGHELGIHHAMVLLDLHDDHGHHTAESQRIELLVAGAFLAELLHSDRLKVDGTKVSVKLGRADSLLLRPIEEVIGGRPTAIPDALHAIVDLGLRHSIHSDLVGRGILKVQQRKRWLVFRESVWPTADPAVERALVEHLRAVAKTASDSFVPEDSVFALLEAANLEASVFDGPVDLSTRVRRCPIGAVVGEILRGRASPNVTGYQDNH